MLCGLAVDALQHPLILRDWIPQPDGYLWPMSLPLLPDAIAALAYGAIALMLAYLARQRQDCPVGRLFTLLSVFLAVAGIVHGILVWAPQMPVYLSAMLQTIDALMAVFVVGRMIPLAQALRCSQDIVATNQELEREIRERQRTENQLRQSEARYRGIVEDQTELICRYSASTKILFVNDAYCRYFNLSREDVLEQSYMPVIYEGDRDRVAYLVSTLNGDNPTITIENRVVVGGQVRWMQWSNRVITDTQNQVIEFQAVGRDITLVKQVEEALRDSELRYRTLIEAIPQIVWVAESDGLTTTDFNQRWFDFTGQSLAQSMHDGWISAVHPDDRATLSSRWGQTVANQGSYEAEYRLRRADGVYVWHLAKAAPLYGDDGRVVRWYGTCTDISDRKQAEDLLERQMIELQRLNLMKDDFLSTVSHELRTPLTNIKMAVQLLELTLEQQGIRLDGPSLPGIHPLSRYLDMLKGQCQQELELVNDLLDLQRINAEAYELELTTIVLQDWLPTLIDSFQERASAQQQRLTLTIPRDVPSLVSDQSALRRILSELLNNACKYTPPGEGIEIEVYCSSASQVSIRICNSGVEIPADEQTRIFEPFYRIPRSDRRQQGGTGLGLALVKRLVLYLGGAIEVESQAQSTCFVLEVASHSPSNHCSREFQC